MIDFSNRNLFTPFTHPEAGVTFHILKRKVTPLQQRFSFVNDSLNADDRNQEDIIICMCDPLRAHGYATGIFGKCHVRPAPTLLGFDTALFPLAHHRYSGQRFIENTGFADRARLPERIEP
jgi:hypothetical protein